MILYKKQIDENTMIMKGATVNYKESFLLFDILLDKGSNTIKIKGKNLICENFPKLMEDDFQQDIS